MRTCFSLVLSLVICSVSAQVSNTEVPSVKLPKSNLYTPNIIKTNWDNPPGVDFSKQGLFIQNTDSISVYSIQSKKIKNPAYFVNNQLVNSYQFSMLNPEEIEDITVLKKDTLLNGIPFYGSVLIKLKNDSKFKIEQAAEFMSLTALKSYDKIKSKLNNQPESELLFSIDGNVVDQDYDQYYIDKNIIRNIAVQKVSANNNKLNFTLINIITKTKENMKKVDPKNIMIRGNDLAAISHD